VPEVSLNILSPDQLDLLGAFHLLDVSNLKVRNSLDRRQIEWVAARVSALNECFY
jgi:hypothetical protein